MECRDPGCLRASEWGPSEISSLSTRHWRLLAARSTQRDLRLSDPRPQRRPHSPRSGTWRTMFPATPSSSTWHGRRAAAGGVLLEPALASWWSRRRNKRHMTGGTGRDVGASRGASDNPRARSREAAGPGAAGARARDGEGSSRASRSRRARRQGEGIFFAGGGPASVQELLGSRTCGLGAGKGSQERRGAGQGLGPGGRGRDSEAELGLIQGARSRGYGAGVRGVARAGERGQEAELDRARVRGQLGKQHGWSPGAWLGMAGSWAAGPGRGVQKRLSLTRPFFSGFLRARTGPVNLGTPCPRAAPRPAFLARHSSLPSPQGQKTLPSACWASGPRFSLQLNPPFPSPRATCGH